MTAVALAFLLWTAVKTNEDVVRTIDGVRVEVLVQDPAWVLAAEPDPPLVSVMFAGPVRELLEIARERPTVRVEVDQITDSVRTATLRDDWVRYAVRQAPDVRVEEFRPGTVRLTFEPVTSRALPIAVPTTGAPVPGFELAGPLETYPPRVQATGARSRFAALDSIRLPPIDLSELSATDTLRMPIDTTGMGLRVAPDVVTVVVPVQPIRPDTTTIARDRSP